MTSGNLVVNPNTAIQTQTPHHWKRRDFVKGVAALAGAAGLSVYDMRSAAADPPPETNKLRIHESPVTCIAPQLVVQELLHAEGFTDVRYVNYPKDTKLWPPESYLSGETDIGFSFSPTDIRFIDAGAPVTILAAAHAGCVELMASKRVRSTRELRGKTAAIDDVPDTKIFISMFAAYVGVNPDTDINWVTQPPVDWLRLLDEGRIDACFTGPPLSVEFREKNVGHVLVNTTTDKPWSQYPCCLIASTKEFVRRYPVATKRALRAILKGVDLCSAEPSRAARVMTTRGFGNYETNFQVLRELPFGKWREVDVADSLRFWALRMPDVGAIRKTPQEIIAQSVDLRFLNELKRELKA